MIGAFEAILFGMLGDITNWLASSSTKSFFYEKKYEFILLVTFLISGIPLVIIADILKYQTIYGNFPMLMRWNFHRLMLSQSMSFFNDEFSGRISTKVMQTALAIRSVYITIGDIFVFIFIYFLTMVIIIGSYSAILLFPFLIWVMCYIIAVRYFVPKISSLSKNRADAISLMSGKITDAYLNIATVKLFSHSQRESKYLKDSMEECMQHVHPHNRLTSLFEIVNHTLSTLLILFTGGTVLILWTKGLASVGSVAAAFAMSFRLMGLSHWIMYEMASLFENIGTVRDGIRILSQSFSVKDKQGALPMDISSGEIIFENISFSYASGKSVINDLNLKIQSWRKSRTCWSFRWWKDDNNEFTSKIF